MKLKHVSANTIRNKKARKELTEVSQAIITKLDALGSTKVDILEVLTSTKLSKTESALLNLIILIYQDLKPDGS